MYRKLYNDHSVAKNGIYALQRGQMPPEVQKEVKSGRAAAMWFETGRYENGQEFHYFKNYISFEHTGWVFPKDHWIKV